MIARVKARKSAGALDIEDGGALARVVGGKCGGVFRVFLSGARHASLYRRRLVEDDVVVT
jgi:hypothetical protein